MVHTAQLEDKYRVVDGIRIHWINNWKEAPFEMEHSAQIQAVSFPKKREIWAIRGRATESVLQHEIAHVKKQHSLYPLQSSKYIRDELEAELVAYEKTGSPQRIVEHLRGIVNGAHELYERDFPWLIREVGNQLQIFGDRIPDSWYNSYYELIQGYNKQYGTSLRSAVATKHAPKVKEQKAGKKKTAELSRMK